MLDLDNNCIGEWEGVTELRCKKLRKVMIECGSKLQWYNISGLARAECTCLKEVGKIETMQRLRARTGSDSNELSKH